MLVSNSDRKHHYNVPEIFENSGIFYKVSEHLYNCGTLRVEYQMKGQTDGVCAMVFYPKEGISKQYHL